MLMKRIQHRLELSFWDITIETLSRNKIARTIYRDAYRLSREPAKFQDWLSLGLTCMAGFISGLGVFLLIAIAS